MIKCLVQLFIQGLSEAWGVTIPTPGDSVPSHPQRLRRFSDVGEREKTDTENIVFDRTLTSQRFHFDV